MIVDRLKNNDGLLLLLSPIILLISAVFQAFQSLPNLFTSESLRLGIQLDFNSWNPWLLIGLNVIMAIGVIVSCNRLCQRLGLFESISNLPLIVGALLYGVVPLNHNTPIIWLQSYLMVAMLANCFNLYSGKKTRDNLFRASFLVGVVLVTDFNLLVITFIPIVIAILSGSVRLRDFFLWTMGVLLPLYLFLGIRYLLAPELVFPLRLNLLLPNISLGLNSEVLSATTLLLLLGVILIMIVYARANSLSHRQKWYLILVFFFACISLVLFVPIEAVIATSVVPMLLVLSRFLIIKANPIMKDAAMSVLLIIAILYQFV